MVEYDLDLFVESLRSATESYDDTGIAFGIGASFNITDKLAIATEYFLLSDIAFEGIDVETDTLGIGIQMSF